MAFNARNAKINSNGNMDYNSDLKLRNCFVCKTLCSNTCETCGESYCSKKCQIADWQSHKFVCFAMPDLIMGPALPNNQQYKSNVRAQHQNHKHIQNECNKSTNSTSRLPTQSQSKEFSFAQPPNNNDDVVLIFAKSSNTFYIRTCSSNDQYIADSKDFDLHGRSSRRILQLPSKEDIVLVKHKGNFYRAIVITTPTAEDDIEVALCDIGNKLLKSLSQMRQISDELRNRKRYNFLLTLEYLPSGVKKTEWTRLQDLISKGTVFKLQFEGDDWASGKNFKLLEKSSGKPIDELWLQNELQNGGGEQISTLETRTIEESMKSLEIDAKNEPVENSGCIQAGKVVLSDFIIETLPELADLIVVDNSTIYVGCVSVILHENLEKFTELHIKVQTFGSNLQDEYEPEPDEMCLAKFQGDWCRAVFYPPNCFLIDYGNLEVIDRKDMRKYPLELKDPCYTNLCHIQNFTSAPVQKIKDNLEKLLEVYSEHKSCICVSGTNDPNEYDVTFPKILDLVKEK